MEKPNTLPWPPLLLVGAILIGYGLYVLYPPGWPPSPFSDFLFALGLLLMGTAAALFILTFKALRSHSTTISPVEAATTLVTSGPFSLSRNPIYLANILVVTGIGLLAGNAWYFLIALLLAIGIQKLAIEREEKHLEHKFGKQWRTYRKHVRRWI